MKQENDKIKVKSLVKAMNLLECFTFEKPELGVSEIANMLNLPKSTVHNIASTFKVMGYVDINPENSKYFLGTKLLHFSYIINSHLGMQKLFLPSLQKISDMVGETVYLGIPHGKEVLYIESLAPMGVSLVRNILGERASMYCTGLGKAMLAFLPNKLELIENFKYKKFTENTITDKEVLLDHLKVVQQRGYSIDNMEHEFGIKCVAVPIFGHDGQVIAAVSVSAPSLRMDNDNMIKYAKIIRDELEPLQHTF